MDMYCGFQPTRGFENDAEAVAWAKEANLYATMYLMYDDNSNHMMNAFQSNGHWNASADELHYSNIEFLKSLQEDIPDLQEVLPEEFSSLFEEAEYSEQISSRICSDDFCF